MQLYVVGTGVQVLRIHIYVRKCSKRRAVVRHSKKHIHGGWATFRDENVMMREPNSRTSAPCTFTYFSPFNREKTSTSRCYPILVPPKPTHLLEPVERELSKESRHLQVSKMNRHHLVGQNHQRGKDSKGGVGKNAGEGREAKMHTHTVTILCSALVVGHKMTWRAFIP